LRVFSVDFEITGQDSFCLCNNFDQEEVINYFNDFGPYFSAIKNNIKKATPITKEKITESMILYENHKQNL